MKIYLSLLLGLIISSCASLTGHTWVGYSNRTIHNNSRLDKETVYLGDDKYSLSVIFRKDSFYLFVEDTTVESGIFYKTEDSLYTKGKKDVEYKIILLNKSELIIQAYLSPQNMTYQFFYYNKRKKGFKEKKYVKPIPYKNGNIDNLSNEWLISEEWNYADDIFEGKFLEKAADDGIDDVEIWYRKEEEQQLRLIVEPQQLCVEEEVKQDIFTYTKENHCYPYSIENNHIHIQKENGTVEWEIIKLNKKEFWYRDVGAENYRIYKCKRG